MSHLEESLDKILAAGRIPGISILVGNDRKIMLELERGYRSLVPARKDLHRNAIYDVASLTKPLVTALLLHMIFESEGLSLDDPVRRFLPEISHGVTIIDLLTHRGGYPAWYPLYLADGGYLDTLAGMSLCCPPGRRVRYSCLGFILLMFLIERITRRSFREMAGEMIFRPLGLERTFLGNLQGDLHSLPGIVPTEMGRDYERKKAEALLPRRARDFHWRTTLITGDTHDGNSCYHGGCAGNAGLFSCTRDLYRLSLQMHPDTTSLLTPDSAELFWKNFTPGKRSHRSAGCKINTAFLTIEARPLSKPAIGHNGFTGCSLWIERKSGNRYILLSNRVHPRVSVKNNFNRVRRRIHRLLKQEGY